MSIAANRRRHHVVLEPGPADRTGSARTRTLLLTFGAMILFCAQATSANAAGPDRPECSISQITRLSDAGAGRPFISGRGTRIVFMSNANPTGTNPGHLPELFLADTATGTTTQLTTGTGFAAPFPLTAAP